MSASPVAVVGAGGAGAGDRPGTVGVDSVLPSSKAAGLAGNGAVKQVSTSSAAATSSEAKAAAAAAAAAPPPAAAAGVAADGGGDADGNRSSGPAAAASNAAGGEASTVATAAAGGAGGGRGGGDGSATAGAPASGGAAAAAAAAEARTDGAQEGAEAGEAGGGGDAGRDEDGDGGEEGASSGESGGGGGWRVKLYQLNDEGQWDDRGTGHISCRMVESLGGTALVVLAEDDGRELMQSKVVDEDVYQRQGDNIITWCEAPPLIGEANNGVAAACGAAGVDLALSFQENVGCLEIWDQICDVQGRFGNEFGRARGGGEVAVPLPEPKMDTLAAILELLKSAGPQAKETYAGMLSEKSGEYVGKLLAVFNDCEDLDDHESLQVLCRIFKAIVGLNDGTLLEVLLADNLFVDMAGVFEYDFELKEKGEHRKFLTETASFKQVLPIPDEEVVQKIHQNFRITFLKDALLRPMMDDAVVGTLNSLTYFNNTEIVQSLQHTDYVRDVFLLLNDPDTGKGGAKRRDILMFLRELFNMAKTLQVAPRDAFYRHLWDEVPLFEVFIPVLQDQEATVAERTACMEVLLASLTHDPALFRTHILKKGGHPLLPPNVNNQAKGSSSTTPSRGGRVAGGGILGAGSGGAGAQRGGAGGTSSSSSPTSDCRALLFWVIRRLTTDQDTGVLLQAAEICRMALDTETMEGQPDRDTFLGVFYEHYVHWLVEPFWLGDLSAEGEANGDAAGEARGSHRPGSAAGVGGGGGARSPMAMLQVSRGHICDLLSFCVRSHTFRMKYFVLRNNVVSRVLRLLSCKDKYLQLSAVRFLRSCVGIKDEFYNRYLVKNNLLAPVFALFRENRGRDNLINSAVIELVEFIRAENVKSLVEHVVERFSSSFVEVEQMATLEGIKLKHDQNVDLRDNQDRDFGGGGDDDGSGLGGGGRGNRAAQNRRRMAEEDGDEAYFNESDDDDDDDNQNPGPQPVVGGDPHEANGALKLVAYGDEDDSEDEDGATAGGSSPATAAAADGASRAPSSSPPRRTGEAGADAGGNGTRIDDNGGGAGEGGGSGATPMVVVSEEEGSAAAAKEARGEGEGEGGGERSRPQDGGGAENARGDGGSDSAAAVSNGAAEHAGGHEGRPSAAAAAAADAVEGEGNDEGAGGDRPLSPAGGPQGSVSPGGRDVAADRQHQEQGSNPPGSSSGGEPDPKRLRLST